MSKMPADKLPTHPGSMIKEEIEARALKQKDLAKVITMSATMFSDLINGRRNITPEIALKLKKALGIPAFSGWIFRLNTYLI